MRTEQKAQAISPEVSPSFTVMSLPTPTRSSREPANAGVARESRRVAARSSLGMDYLVGVVYGGKGGGNSSAAKICSGTAAFRRRAQSPVDANLKAPMSNEPMSNE